MGIGFFRKLKDFGKKVWNFGKRIVGKVLPVAAPIIKTVLPKVLPQAAPFIDPVLNVASNITGVNMSGNEPQDDDIDDYDDDNEYMKVKNGV